MLAATIGGTAGAPGVRSEPAWSRRDSLNGVIDGLLRGGGPEVTNQGDSETGDPMDAPSFTNLLGVGAIAFAAPFLLGLAPSLRLPSIVLEIIAGIVVGPAGFGWIEVDQT